MRSLISICLAAIMLIAAPAPGRSEEGGGLTIAIFGDSLGDGVWGGLYLLLRKHPDIRLLHLSKVGAGLTRPDYANWLNEFKSQIENSPIDVAVVMFGANDQQGIRDANRKGYAFPSSGWKSVYTNRVADVMSALEEHHVETVWLGLPVMRNDDINTGARTLDAIFAATAKTYGVTFLPLAKDYVDENGGFKAYLVDAQQRNHQLRADDGIHFTSYGYELIASKVWQTIQRKRTAAAHDGMD